MIPVRLIATGNKLVGFNIAMIEILEQPIIWIHCCDTTTSATWNKITTG